MGSPVPTWYELSFPDGFSKPPVIFVGHEILSDEPDIGEIIIAFTPADNLAEKLKCITRFPTVNMRVGDNRQTELHLVADGDVAAVDITKDHIKVQYQVVGILAR